MTFNQEHFNQFIIENNVIGFFNQPITLKSGKQSQFYVNWRTITQDVFLTECLADYILDFVQSKNLSFNCFYGVPEGATKIALITQYKSAHLDSNYSKNSHCLPMGRGKIKEHGALKDKYFLGEPQGEICVLEDVTTTGGSLLKTIDQLIESGEKHLFALGLTNRNDILEKGKTVQTLFQEKNIPYFPLSNALDLLPQAYQQQQPGEDIARKVEQEFEYQGSKRLSLL